MTESRSEQVRVRTVLMRGGSSKAVFLDESSVPRGTEQRARFLLALFGSPDKRQIDGLGGADVLTSKCALVGPPSRSDADIDYTFVQVSVAHPVVSYDISCGNITAAVGVYAVEEGYVRPTDPATVVRVHNTNTGQIIRIEVPVHEGIPCVEGDFAVDGVPGTGAEVKLDFSGTAGAATGKILPTGNVRDRIAVAALGREIEVSIVDVANPCAFVAAADLGLTGAELPGEVPAHILEALEEIRVASCRIGGIDSYLLPFQVIVGPPRTCNDFVHGRALPAEQCDSRRASLRRAQHAQGIRGHGCYLPCGRRAHPGHGAACQLPARQCASPDSHRPPEWRAAIVADVALVDGRLERHERDVFAYRTQADGRLRLRAQGQSRQRAALRIARRQAQCDPGGRRGDVGPRRVRRRSRRSLRAFTSTIPCRTRR